MLFSVYSMTKRLNFWVHVSPGSAETLARGGGITNHHLIAYSLSNISAKNYQNASHAYATMSVSICLSVTEVHWCIIANLGFKFRSKFTAHCGRGSIRCMPGRGEGSSRAMLATARPSCFGIVHCSTSCKTDVIV